MKHLPQSSRRLGALTLLLAVLVSAGELKAGGDKITTLPAAVDAAVKALVPGYQLRRAEREDDDGNVIYEIKGTGDGLKFEMEVTERGTVLESKIESTNSGNGSGEDEGEDEGEDSDEGDGESGEHDRDDGKKDTRPANGFSLPETVLETLSEAVPDFRIEEAKLTTIDGIEVYEIEGFQGSKRIEIFVALTGEIVRLEVDSDDDGLSDAEEAGIGSDPENRDTDGDAFPDGFETGKHSNPLDAAAVPQILGIEIMPGHDGAGDFVKLSVSTFAGSGFVLEHCPDAESWESLGVSLEGDDQTHEIMIPVDDARNCGFFRVSIGELTEMDSGDIGGGSGTTGTCFAPDSLDGLRFDLEIGDEESGELAFGSRNRGQRITTSGKRVDVEPFSYDYRRTGECGGVVTVSFPRSGEDYVIKYELQFTEDGKGTVVRKEAGGSDSGSFSYRKKSDWKREAA